MKVKRILAGLLAILMLLSLAGCKSDDSVTESGNGGNDSGVNKDVFEEEKTEYADDKVLFSVFDVGGHYDGTGYETLYYNYKGELLKQSSRDYEWLEYYAENGLTIALDKVSCNYGYTDMDGVFKIEPKYMTAYPFSNDGIALVVNQEGKCGYVNSEGETVIPFIYDEAVSFYNCGYAITRIYENSEESGQTFTRDYVIDKEGNIIIEMDSSKVGNIRAVYDNYFVCASLDGSKYLVFDYDGNKLAEKYIENYRLVKAYFAKDNLYIYTYEDLQGAFAYCVSSEWGATLNENIKLVKCEKFNGKEFKEYKNEYEIVGKRVSITQSGFGYGIEKDGEIKIPFEYDLIQPYGSYFVAIKFTGSEAKYNQIIDIYDSDFNKTAESIPYAFDDRNASFGAKCQLPDGYFSIMVKNEGELSDDDDFGEKYGVIDYKGNIIIEPTVVGQIRLYTYEGMINTNY